MKRTFLFLAAFAVVATSCSKNTLVDTPSVVYDASTINFAPSTGLSKANDNGLAEVKAGFEVFALVNGGKDVDKNPLPDRMYFTKPAGTENTYTFASGAWAWAGGDTEGKKWPTDASKYPMTFLAMFPASGLATNYAVVAPAAMAWTEVITQGTTTADTKDYLSATTIQPAAPLSGQLSSLKFKHIMSQINFSVNIPTGYTVYVTKAIYHNLHNVNTYNFLTQTWDSTKVGLSAGTVAYIADNGAVQSFTGKAYEAPAAPAVAPKPAPAYASHAIAVAGGNSIKALPQYFAKAWEIATFTAEGKRWTTANATTPETWPTAKATEALATGTYVELQYALVDANDVCLVGLINGKKQMIAGVPTEYKGVDQFLRVAYLVDLSKRDDANPPAKSKFTSALEQGKKYTYKIALGTPDATGGTVLDPNYIKADDTTGDDSGKEPGDDVNNKAEYIGFTVDVDKWNDDTEGSFEPIPTPVPVP